MQFTYTGNNFRFLEQSFFDPDGFLSVEITSVTPTEVVLTHTVFTQANVNVVLRGLGFSTDAQGDFTSGVITSMVFNGLEIEQGRITDITWDAATFQGALFDIADRSDFNAIAQLFNASPEISIDASGALSRFNQ